MGYTQCHFFAGIGGWSRALALAGWPEDRAVWTGSCPCQPFSAAGKQKAQSDERHLWPAWFKLISAAKPQVVFGEQVSGAIAHSWLDDTFNDLESQGYETFASVLPACSVGAPHKRDRLWFVAKSSFELFDGSGNSRAQRWPEYSNGSKIMADTDQPRSQGRDGAELPECTSECLIGSSSAYAAHSDGEPPQRFTEPRSECNFWQFEPAVGRVANGISARVGKLRAFGNAIVPQVAQEFIEAFMECRP